jgi:hypothetical protein
MDDALFQIDGLFLHQTKKPNILNRSTCFRITMSPILHWIQLTLKRQIY